MLYILPHCIFLLHHSRFMARHAQALQSKCQPQKTENMLSTALGFLIGKRVTESLLHFSTRGHRFSPRVAAIMSSTQVVKKSVQTVQIEIYLWKESCSFISTQHITREHDSTTPEHGSTSRKVSFSFTHLVLEENK